MSPTHLVWLINGGMYVVLLVVVSYLFSLTVLTSILLLLLPIALPLFYHYTAYPPSPHGHHFHQLRIAHRGGRHRRSKSRTATPTNPLPSSQETENEDNTTTLPQSSSSTASVATTSSLISHPENSLDAFRFASQHSEVGAVELDVYLSGDGVPVVLHDGFLHRMFEGGTGHVRHLTVKQLQKLTFKPMEDDSNVSDDEEDNIISPSHSHSLLPSSATVPSTSTLSSPSPSPSSPPGYLPTLEEVVELILPTHLKLMIEVKEIHHPQLMALALHSLFRRHPSLYQRAFVASFLPFNLLLLRRLSPAITTAMLGHPHLSSLIVRQAKKLGFHVQPWIEYNYVLRGLVDGLGRLFNQRWIVKWMGCSAVCVHVSEVSQLMIGDYQKLGLDVKVWTVNSQEMRVWLEKHKCSCITDYPFAISKD